MNPQEISKTTEQKMVKSLESLQLAYTKIRTGRAHTGLLEHILVDYYGTPTQLPQVASITLV
ncbi:MAG: ribosome recycling factor, partial [Burkholderiaceae bacterium]